MKLSSSHRPRPQIAAMSSNSLILSRGFLRFWNTRLTKLEILHHVTQNIHASELKIARTAIFEHPLSAVLYFLPTSTSRSFVNKLIRSSQVNSAPQHILKLKLSLSDIERQSNLHQLKYLIETTGKFSVNQISILSNSADELSRDLTRNIIGIEDQERQPQYPNLVYSR